MTGGYSVRFVNGINKLSDGGQRRRYTKYKKSFFFFLLLKVNQLLPKCIYHQQPTEIILYVGRIILRVDNGETSRFERVCVCVCA